MGEERYRYGERSKMDMIRIKDGKRREDVGRMRGGEDERRGG